MASKPVGRQNKPRHGKDTTRPPALQADAIVPHEEAARSPRSPYTTGRSWRGGIRSPISMPADSCHGSFEFAYNRKVITQSRFSVKHGFATRHPSL